MHGELLICPSTQHPSYSVAIIYLDAINTCLKTGQSVRSVKLDADCSVSKQQQCAWGVGGGQGGLTSEQGFRI